MPRPNLRIALLIAGFFAAALAIQLTPLKSGVEKQQVNAMVQRLKPVPAQEIVRLIAESRGIPVMLFVYASWCPHCRASFEAIEEMTEKNEFNGIKRIFVSADVDFNALAEYIILKQYDQMFEPYILKRSGVKTPEEIFRTYGGTFNGGIPYFAFFHRDNTLAREFGGKADVKTLRKFIKEIRPPETPRLKRNP